MKAGPWKENAARTTGMRDVAIAFEFVKRYGDKTPSARRVMKDFGMPRPTAYRWIRGYKDAKGEA